MTLNKNIRYFAVSDIGHIRKRNEDAYAVYGPFVEKSDFKNGEMLFVVADGIGGHSCGDLASQMVCSGFSSFSSTTSKETTPKEWSRRMADHIHSIDSSVRARATGDPACADMGTTLSSLLIVGGFGVIAHVGDSRIYRMRGDRLRQLTTDHTFVQEMIEEGELTKESAVNHPLRNVLTKAVGTQEPLENIEIKVIAIKQGDRFLLASDGLHDMVTVADIEMILNGSREPEPSARQLVAAALKNGGRDNITVIVVDF